LILLARRGFPASAEAMISQPLKNRMQR